MLFNRGKIKDTFLSFVIYTYNRSGHNTVVKVLHYTFY